MSRPLVDLQRLRRQAGARDVPATPPSASAGRALPLDALRRRLQRDAIGTAARAVDERALPGHPLADGVRLVERRYPGFEAVDLVFDRAPAALDSGRLLCVDTETTGLSGGTGTRAFMIGAADWWQGELRVRQLLLTRLGGEAAMLAEFARWLAPRPTLLSYNGKCYDLPLLRTRWRLARQADASAGLDHVDLLHAVRRRYRGVWDDCRLGTIERELLRIARRDDLPGSEAPAAFTRWLRGGEACDLVRVLEHNAQDLRSLALLARQLGDAATLALIG